MGRKAQVVLKIDEDIIGSFIKKYFNGDRTKAVSILSMVFEDLGKDFVLEKKHFKVMVLDKGGKKHGSEDVSEETGQGN